MATVRIPVLWEVQDVAETALHAGHWIHDPQVAGDLNGGVRHLRRLHARHVAEEVNHPWLALVVLVAQRRERNPRAVDALRL